MALQLSMPNRHSFAEQLSIHHSLTGSPDKPRSKSIKLLSSQIARAIAVALLQLAVARSTQVS